MTSLFAEDLGHYLQSLESPRPYPLPANGERGLRFMDMHAVAARLRRGEKNGASQMRRHMRVLRKSIIQ